MMQRVARQCGLSPPTTVLSSGDETWLQMVEWCQETIEDLTTRHDWRVLHKLQTLTGDGSTTAFSLASDFGRLAQQPAVSRDGSVSWNWPVGPLSPAKFINADSSLTGSVTPAFQIEGTTLTFAVAPASGEAFTVSYQSKKPVNSASTYYETWQLDTDLVVIPERPVILGTVWRWKAAKGKAYSEAMNSAERAFESLAGHDWGLMAVDLSSTDVDDEFGDLTVTV